MKKFLTFMLLNIILNLAAQTQIKKSSISTNGGTLTSTDNSTTIIYSIGEVAVNEQNNGTIHVSEGFIGPDLANLLGVENYTPIKNISIYPNPTKDIVNIDFDQVGNYRIYLFDQNGKLLIDNTINNNDKIKLNLERFATSIYFINIIDKKNKKYLTYKIEKSK